MVEKIVRVRQLSAFDQTKEDLEYWLGKTPEERIEAVEILRRQVYGTSERLQRVARIVQRSQR